MVKLIRYMLFICILTIPARSDAQFNFKQGRIFTAENDTIEGLISDAGSIKNGKVCVFKKDRKSSPLRYYPENLSGYEFTGGKRYVSKKVSNEYGSAYGFAEVLLQGKLNLYYFYKNTYPLYYIQKEGERLTGLRNEEIYNPTLQYTYPPNWKSYKLGTSIFKDTLFALFQDQPAVLNQLVDVEYTHKSLVNISKEYIHLTCSGSECIRYEKDLARISPEFGIYSGITLSKVQFRDYTIYSELTTSLPFGLFYMIPLTPVSERLSFQTDLSYSRMNYARGFVNLSDDLEDLRIKKDLFAVSFSLNYKFPGEKLSPRIGLGKEQGFVIDSEANYKTSRFDEDGIWKYGDVENLLHRIQKGGWFLETGIDFHVHPAFSIFTNIRLQQTYNLIIPEKNYSYLTFTIADITTDSEFYTTNAASLLVGIKF